MKLPANFESAVGAFILRVALGLLLFVPGLAKLLGGPTGIAQYIDKQFSETWLPKVLYMPYAYALPYLEFIIGLAIVLGVVRGLSLSLGGLLMLSLAFGQIIIKGDAMANNIIFTALFTAALLLVRRDVWNLDALIFSGKPAAAESATSSGD